MKRGALSKTDSKLIPVLIPKWLLPKISTAVTSLDTDRSKFIREAIREKLNRQGINTENTNT